MPGLAVGVDEVAQEGEGADDDAAAFWFEVLVFVHVVPVQAAQAVEGDISGGGAKGGVGEGGIGG